MFLQIMEDGRLTDITGRTVSFKDTVIIMTSNAGTGEIDKSLGNIGFTEDENVIETENMIETLRNYFKPEFLNRIDSIVQFNHLEKEHLIQIIDIMLAELETTLKEQDYTIEVTKDAKEKIAELGYDQAFGARPLRRAIQQHVEDQITMLIIDSEEKLNHFHVDVAGDEVKVIAS